MPKTITEKSTKTDILDAYNEVIAKVKEQKAADQKAVKKEVEEKNAVESASQNTIEDIVKKLASLKLEIVKSIDGLEEKLIAEQKRFTELKLATTVQAAEIDEMYSIQAEAGSLAALVAAQKEKRASFDDEMEARKASFEAEMTQRKLQWKKEQDDFDATKRERDGQLKKERQREEEEYTYNLQLQRKKDADAYGEKKAALENELQAKKAFVEKDLTDREIALASREKELEELRARLDAFPDELERAIKETEKMATEKLEFKYKFQADLAAKDVEAEKRLNKQIIGALERKISEQEEQIHQLTQKADDSVQQVQTIAVKAIEGASTQRIFAERSKDNG